VSAKVLASELDSLDLDLETEACDPHKVSTDRTNLKLNLDGGATTGKPCTGAEDKPKPDNLTLVTCNDLESRWLLLDCCYGIPLFDAHVNRQVCDRISAQGLCNKDR
jgi:hypothetical protein